MNEVLLRVRKELPATRCEICHQSDRLDLQTGECDRCVGIQGVPLAHEFLIPSRIRKQVGYLKNPLGGRFRRKSLSKRKTTPRPSLNLLDSPGFGFGLIAAFVTAMVGSFGLITLFHFLDLLPLGFLGPIFCLLLCMVVFVLPFIVPLKIIRRKALRHKSRLLVIFGAATGILLFTFIFFVCALVGTRSSGVI